AKSGLRSPSMPFSTVSALPRTSFMRASSSLSAVDARPSRSRISSVRANALARSTRLRASSASRIPTTLHATERRRCPSVTRARGGGRGSTSAIASATAPATATKKNQTFDQNTAASLPQREARRDLHRDIDVALGGDVHRLLEPIDPAIPVEHAQL